MANEQAAVVDLNELIDGQGINRSGVIFLIIATLAMVGDGFDLSAIGFVAPELIKQWHIAPKELVPAFSAGVFGLLLGAPLFGYFGDRLGRKKTILIGLCIFGGFTLVTMAATSLNQLVVLRFLTGLGLGGMIPNIIALAAEVAPKRLRGMFVIIVNFGVPAGIALPGITAAALVPQYGWPVLMLVGGVLPLVIAVAAWIYLPESIKFLAQRGNRDDEVRRLARAMRPDVAIDQRTRFTVPAQAAKPGALPTPLFARGLAFVTPMVWIALAANQFANFFTINWLPTILQSAGLSTAEAGWSAAMFSFGGIAGGLILTFIIDRLGALPVLVLFLLGAPAVAAIGIPGSSAVMLMVILAAAGFCVTGNNFGMNAVIGMIYPTPIRSMGTGWAQGFGRIGALAAQIAGGYLLAMHLSTLEVYLVPACAMVVGAVAAGALVRLCVRRFGGYRIDESAASTVELPAAIGVRQPAQ